MGEDRGNLGRHRVAWKSAESSRRRNGAVATRSRYARTELLGIGWAGFPADALSEENRAYLWIRLIVAEGMADSFLAMG